MFGVLKYDGCDWSRDFFSHFIYCFLIGYTPMLIQRQHSPHLTLLAALPVSDCFLVSRVYGEQRRVGDF